MSHQQGQVQADTELGILPGQLHGFVAGRFIDHQTCGGQNAFAMRADDGFVDRVQTPEIVSVDDEAADGFRAFHNLPFLSRR